MAGARGRSAAGAPLPECAQSRHFAPRAVRSRYELMRVPRPPPQLVAVLPGVLLAAFQLGRFVDRSRVLDDSFICFRIARNWVEHGAPVFNLTGPPADAATSPLWLVLS